MGDPLVLVEGLPLTDGVAEGEAEVLSEGDCVAVVDGVDDNEPLCDVDTDAEVLTDGLAVSEGEVL